MTIGRSAPSSSARQLRGLLVASVIALNVGIGLPLALANTTAAGVAGVVMIAVLALVMTMVRRHYPYDRLGFCNHVTLLRATFVAALIGLLFVGVHGWPVLIIAAIGLALDGVDGWLARREGLSSAFGARFDMETDAALALILAGHVWMAGMTGPEILILGLMRYMFVIAFWPCPWLAAPLPERFGRKLVCVIQIAALILLQVPDLSRSHATLIAWSAVLALIWSFGRDTLWLWRNRT